MKIARDLSALYRAISKEMELYLPITKSGVTDFDKYAEGAQVSLDTLKTSRSPKDFFFRQSETLMAFEMKGKSITVSDKRPHVNPFAVFGVRACDAKSFEILDRVFLADPVDTVYQARRKAGVIISLACNAPESDCFCNLFGIDAAAPGGDVRTYHTKEGLYWQPLSDKGEALTGLLSAVLEDCDDNAPKAQQAQIKERLSKLPLSNMSLDHLVGANEQTFWNHPVWEQMSQTCLACGTCTYVCPTCQCYDVRDFDCGEQTERSRCWDSCMYSDFTLMAHGNNRNTQSQRFRQRFLHKLVYMPQRNGGEFGCVGCGRCVRKCPSKLGIVKVIKALGGNENE